MKKLLIVLALLSFAIVGCSDDDSTDPSSNTGIIPLAVGNWWDYEEYEYDSETEEMGELINEYRTEIVAKTNYEGKEAYEIKQKGSDGTAKTYLAQEEGKIFLGGENFGIPSEDFSKWTTLFDDELDTWETQNYEFEQSGITQKVKGTGSYEGEITVNIDGKLYDGFEVKLTTVTESKGEVNGQVIDRKTTLIQEYLIVKGIGIFQTITSYEGIPTSSDQLSNLIDYDVSN